MNTSAALTEYLYSKDFTSRSVRWYEQHLRLFFAWCAQHGCQQHQPTTELEKLNSAHIREFLLHLRTDPSERYGRIVSTHTAHAYARVIKAFLHWCIEEGWVQERILKNVEMPKVVETVIKPLTAEHIARLMAACESQPAHLAARDKAIIAMLVDTGIRATELTTLTLDKLIYNREEAYCTVFGKGRKERQVGLGSKARLLVHRYIHRHREAFCPAEGENTVFLAVGGRALTRDGLDQMLYRMRDKAQITGVRVSAHSFRHTYALNYMRNGGEIYKLSRLLGHTRVTVTENYLRAFLSEDARKGSKSVFDNL